MAMTHAKYSAFKYLHDLASHTMIFMNSRQLKLVVLVCYPESISYQAAVVSHDS